MNRVGQSVLWFAVATFYGSPCHLRPAYGEPPVEVLTAWRARAQRVDRYQYRLSQQLQISGRYLTEQQSILPGARQSDDDTGDVQRQIVYEVLRDGDQLRLLSESAGGESSAMDNRNRKFFFDGKLHTALAHRQSSSGTVYLEAVLHANNRSLGQGVLIPILLHHDAAGCGLLRDPQTLEPDDQFSVGGQQTGELVLRTGNIRVWVDLDRGSVITRFAVYYPDGITKKREVLMAYQRDDTIGWALSSWQSIRLDQSSQLKDEYKVTVDKFDVPRQLPANAFSPELPAHTLVIDERNPSAITRYITRNDGEWFLIHGRVEFEELVQASENPLGNSRQQFLWLIVINGSVIVLLACLLLWLRRQRSAPRESASSDR